MNIYQNQNADSDKYSYSAYNIRFNSHSLSLIQNFDFGKNVIIFGVDNSPSKHADNRKKDILDISCDGNCKFDGRKFNSNQ